MMEYFNTMKATRCMFVGLLMLALLVVCAGCTQRIVYAPDESGTAVDTSYGTTQAPQEQWGAPSTSSFAIEGKWKNTGEGTYGQMEQGAIVVFDGTNCNVLSPSDTYAFYEENGTYHLDVTGLLGGSPSFIVTIVDNDHIELTKSSISVSLTRVG